MNYEKDEQKQYIQIALQKWTGEEETCVSQFRNELGKTEDEIEVTLVGLPRYPCTESTTVCYNNESND